MKNNFSEKAKNHLLKMAEKAGPEHAYLFRHVPLVEKWAVKFLETENADKDVVLTAVWLHDIGVTISGREGDHAISSEKETERFLNEIGAKENFISRVCHCVRSHRCKDVLPQTTEAKIVAAADSSSHMIDTVYIILIKEGKKQEALAKLERDFRDKSLVSSNQKELTKLYKAWKKLLLAYPEF